MFKYNGFDSRLAYKTSIIKTNKFLIDLFQIFSKHFISINLDDLEDFKCDSIFII